MREDRLKSRLPRQLELLLFGADVFSYNRRMSLVPIYTIGYGTREIAQLLAILRTHEIAYLLDVRSQPYSRYKPDFSQDALIRHLAAAGIRYVFMGDALGGKPEDPNCYTNGQVDYDKIAQQPFYQAGIRRLKAAYEQQQRVVLLCSEGKPEQCHRALLIGRSLAASGIALAHIDEQDRLLSQAAVLARLHGDQLPLLPPAGSQPETTAPPLPPPEPDFDDAYLLWEGEALSGSAAPFDGDAPFYDDGPPYEAMQGEIELDLPGRVAYEDPQVALKQVYGFDSFRPMQAEIIQNMLHKRDTLAVMPTGSGKSLCYQLPALIFPGLTVVVSPLISLMEDQVMQLREVGVAAVFLNSTLSSMEYRGTVALIRSGRVNLLYAAPETLLRPDILVLLEQCHVDCLTIDEAHCISEWGHDFRPEYRQLVDVRRRLPGAVCLAVTATATEQVQQDIKRSLGIAAAHEFIASFNRDNLFLHVTPRNNGLAQVEAFLQAHKGDSGIIYCATRRQVDTLTRQLAHLGWPVLPYHAGLDDATRRQHQQQFIRDDVPIMVATIAFGMGINKPNVRFVLHYDLPKNLESYYQQIGRAGRDGLPADCLLLYSYSEVQTFNHFIRQQDVAQQAGSKKRLAAMLSYAETNECRRRPLLAYFGEAYQAASCDLCDNCTATGQALVDLTIPAQKFLSCVKRTGERFGMSHIISVLRGSRSQKVLSYGHDRVSTYNIGTEYSREAWQHLGRQFVQQGLLRQEIDTGGLRLTPQGYAVFKGEKVLGTLPEAPAQVAAAHEAHDPALFALLRARRKALADAANLPPYAIFSDRSLVEMATYFPQSPEAFATMYGVGEAKLARYAASFLPIIQAYCAERGIAEGRKGVAAATVAAAPRPGGVTGRAAEVLTLYNNGQPLAEVAGVYGVKLATVINHLYKAVLAGETLHSDGLLAASGLPAAEQARALAVFAELGTSHLRPVYEALGERVSYDELHLLRLYWVASRPGGEAQAGEGNTPGAN